MDPRQEDLEDVRRERRAEKLRRSYEALGREQNAIFESLSEYTHEVQAKVRALQIARDRLHAEQQAFNNPPGGQEGASLSSISMVPLRIGQPHFVGDRWVSFEAAAAGAVICGLFGVIVGAIGWCRWQQGTVTVAARRKSYSNNGQPEHED